MFDKESRKMPRCHLVAVPLVVALVAGCQSKPPQPPPDAVAAQAAAAAAKAAEPAVKPQEATPQQRAQVKVDLAAGYYERGRFDVSLQELAEAQKLDPNNAKIYNVYGLTYTMLGENQKAEESFRRALSIAPNDSEIRHNWGAFLCATGREAASIPEFETVIRDPLYKTPETALINAGKCSIATGDVVKGDEYLRRALAISPGNAMASYNLALLSYRQNRYDQARAYMRNVMQQTNPAPEALFLGMCIERKKGDRSAELSYVSQLRNRYPESPEAKAIDVGACG
jgi:type IV pilus assembly protein PilF